MFKGIKLVTDWNIVPVIQRDMLASGINVAEMDFIQECKWPIQIRTLDLKKIWEIGDMGDHWRLFPILHETRHFRLNIPKQSEAFDWVI